MTPFAALSKTTAASGASSSSSSSSFSSSPPEVIQLHSNLWINFLDGTIVTTAAAAAAAAVAAKSIKSDGVTTDEGYSRRDGGGWRPFSSLSYQAVRTRHGGGGGYDDDGYDRGGNSSTTMTIATASTANDDERGDRRGGHDRPDLGVWDCRVDDGGGGGTTMSTEVDGDRASSSSSSSSSSSGVTPTPRASTILRRVVVANADRKSSSSSSSVPTVIMTVDLADPSRVRRTVEDMRRVILDTYDDIGVNHDDDEDGHRYASSSSSSSSYRAATTSMRALRDAKFGRARIAESAAVGGGTERGCGSNGSINLLLAAIVPPRSSSSSSSSPANAAVDEYVERQTRALVMYHLRKFALEANCALCFVSDDISVSGGTVSRGPDDDDDDAGGGGGGGGGGGRGGVGGVGGGGDTSSSSWSSTISTMSVDELGRIARRVAMGMPPAKDARAEDDVDDYDGPNDGTSRGTPLPPCLIPPDTHDPEFVYGAMMRNASCDGRWDAANDDIDVALPSSISGCGGRGMADEPSSVVGSVGVGGDEIWLAQLATSIGISTDPSAAASVAVAGTTATSVSDSLLSPKMERAASSSTTKKRLTSRVPSTRNKDSKPKDEKEVMSFFDNLLKK